MENKICPICKKSIKEKNVKAVYCSPGCKQEAYRQRNGLDKPEFIKNSSPQKKEIKVNIEEQLSEFPLRISEIESKISFNENEKLKFIKKLSELENNEKNNVQSKLMNKTINSAFDGNFKAAIVLGSLSFLMKKVNAESPQQIKKRKRLISQYKAAISESDNLINGFSIEKMSLEKQYLDLKEEFKRHFENFLIIKHKEEQEEKKIRLNNAKITPLTLDEIKAIEFNVYEFSDDLKELFGNPSKYFKAMVYGSSGNGKTTWVINFANYFAESFGKVLFNSSEEGISYSLREKLMISTSQNLYISEAKNYNDLRLLIDSNEYNLLIIDSLNDMKLTSEQCNELNNLPIAIVYILQANKNKNFKGNSTLAHDSDIILKVENYIVEVEKTRFK